MQDISQEEMGPWESKKEKVECDGGEYGIDVWQCHK